MPKANNRNIYEERPWLNDDVQNRTVLRQIVGGGSDITVEEVTFTENGDYTAPEGKAYSPVHVDVSGGGSSDFSTAEVTFVNNSEEEVFVFLPIVVDALPIPPFYPAQSSSDFSLVGEEELTFSIILYKGNAGGHFTGASTAVATGDIVIDLDSFNVTGDGTVTFS